MKTNKKLNISIPKNNFIEESKQILSKSECQHIINDIYLSGYRSANDLGYLKNNNFTHIINCAASSSSYKPIIYDEFTYLKLDLKDEPGFDIIYYIYLCIDFIEKADICKNRKILIHCYEGKSRAPTLLCSYLIWKFNYEKDFAMKIIKDKRECIDINLGFLYQLEKWYDDRRKHLFNDKIIKIEKCGNISLIDKNYVSNEKCSQLNDKLYIIDNFEVNYEKLNKFLSMLQKYENYPKIKLF